MSHDIEAAWASAEVVANLRDNPSLCFARPPSSGISIYASSEGRRHWPVSDGLIHIETRTLNYNVAVEYKRKNEGLHGILTAIGQAHAYLHKGFNGSLIVIPNKYESHERPGNHIVEIIDATTPACPIGVFTYGEPDTSVVSPFRGKLSCLRHLDLDVRSFQTSTTQQPISRITTQWGHVREGSTDPHAFYCYLKTSKELASNSGQQPQLNLPQGLIDACANISSAIPPLKYLSNSSGDTFHDQVWRMFWFTYVFNDHVIPIWTRNSSGQYEVNEEPSSIQQWNGTRKKFFVGRIDSIKNKLVRKLNLGEISEQDAWEEYARKVRNRAHSYREDIDSGLEAFGFLEHDGRPTELGYKFVDSCDRTGTYITGTPRALFGAALLNNANFGALLHYIFKSSENKFSLNPLSFTVTRTDGRINFDRNQYLDWLEDQLANRLGVMRKVSQRGGQSRKPFQAEFAILRHLGLVQKYRLGVGIEINWPKVQELMQYPI